MQATNSSHNNWLCSVSETLATCKVPPLLNALETRITGYNYHALGVLRHLVLSFTYLGIKRAHSSVLSTALDRQGYLGPLPAPSPAEVSALCHCGNAVHTPKHILLHCESFVDLRNHFDRKLYGRVSEVRSCFEKPKAAQPAANFILW